MKHIRNCLNKAIDYAVDPCSYIKENPALRTRMPKFDQGQVNPHHLISEEDYKRILDRFGFGNRYHMILVLG